MININIIIIIIGGVGGGDAHTSRERFLLFEGEDGATSPTPLKDIFNNSDVVKSSRIRDDSDVLKCNRLFGTDMKVKLFTQILKVSSNLES